MHALRGVHLTAFGGEVHALVGENGAGKSTLMKILSGAIPAGDYEGKLFLDGKPHAFRTPKEAEAAGIAIIHQELSAFAHLSVAENLFVGSWPGRFGLVNDTAMVERARALLERVGAAFSPLAPMQELSTGDQQLVEIAKALGRDSRVLILDEPTSSLSKKESDRLFLLVKELRAQGRALVYISHRMEEIFSLADRVTVLRDGKSVKTAPAAELSEAQLITHMVGRELGSLFPPRPAPSYGSEALRLTAFTARAKNGRRVVGPIDLTVRRGEIVGLGGLLGAGRSEFLQALLGDENYETQGEVRLKGKPFVVRGPKSSYRQGLARLSEDRKRESILPTRDLNENAGIQRLSLGRLAAFVKNEKEEESTREWLRALKTRYHDVHQKIGELSGGNQQKLLIARILQNSPDLLILDEPTRGVDVGAKFEIYEILFSLLEKGKAILLVSSDLPELLALSDRVLVLAEGRLRGEVGRGESSQERVMELAVQP